MKNLIELVYVVSSLEDGLASEELGKDTAHGPDIDGRRVVLETQHNLRRSIPPRSNVLCHEASSCLLTSCFWVRLESSGQAKVANLELTVGIDEEVSRFQISMQHTGGVDVLETTQRLVDEALEVGV